MRYLLDTSICIAHLRGRAVGVTEQLIAHAANVSVCSIVKAELLFGLRRSTRPHAELEKVETFVADFPSLPFDDNAAQHAARIRADLAERGTPIGPYDLLIAAIAQANSHTLVTCNAAEFKRVPGLLVEDWRSQ